MFSIIKFEKSLKKAPVQCYFDTIPTIDDYVQNGVLEESPDFMTMYGLDKTNKAWKASIDAGK